MARLHELVVLTSESTNLLELSGFLMEAVQIVLDHPEKIAPHLHPCVRFICYQIAFAGDGDIKMHEYYKDILDYCVVNAEFEVPIGKVPEYVEVSKAS